MSEKKELVREVHQSILFGVKKIHVETGDWDITGPDVVGCHRYSMQYAFPNVPDEDWSLVITTQDETTRYYFYYKNYNVQLCPDKLHIKYTKEESM